LREAASVFQEFQQAGFYANTVKRHINISTIKCHFNLLNSSTEPKSNKLAVTTYQYAMNIAHSITDSCSINAL